MMIDRDDKLPVGTQAALLGISRGAVYYTPRPTSEADLALMRRIDELHLEHPFMGQRMLIRQLKREGTVPQCQTSCRPIMIAEDPHWSAIYDQNLSFD